MVADVETKKAKKVAIIKKRKAHFKRHHSDRYMRVGESWRKPKGIDSCVRRRFKGQAPMPKIGYGSDKRTRHMLPIGLRKFRVSNVRELESVFMHTDKFAVEIAHNVSAKKRIAIVKAAKERGYKVINEMARIQAQE